MGVDTFIFHLSTVDCLQTTVYQVVQLNHTLHSEYDNTLWTSFSAKMHLQGPSACFVVFLCMRLLYLSTKANSYEADVVYKFVRVDYNWTNEAHRQAAFQNGDYIVENNIITGIKVYQDTVYVTVPRWRKGIPATLNYVIPHVSGYGHPKLQPFPSWDSNRVSDCSALQYVQSMEIDPNTGYMWIIDMGRIETASQPSPPQNLCPPKLVIFDLSQMETIRVYEFPDHVVSHSTNFMNDIVLDYVAGRARFAYITDTRDAKLYVYDYDRNISYFYQHPSMNEVSLEAGQSALISAPIDGIAMSPDFKMLYYSPLSALSLYAIPTAVLRNNGSDFGKHLKTIGSKIGGSDGMAFGANHIFFGAFESDALYMAPIDKNGVVSLANQVEVVSNNETAVWIDTLAFNGTDLWFVANKLNSFFRNSMNFTASEGNIHIWRVRSMEAGYLQGANAQASTNSARPTVTNSALNAFGMLTIVLVISKTNR